MKSSIDSLTGDSKYQCYTCNAPIHFKDILYHIKYGNRFYDFCGTACYYNWIDITNPAYEEYR